MIKINRNLLIGVLAVIASLILFMIAHSSNAQTEDVDLKPSAGLYSVPVHSAPSDPDLEDTASVSLYSEGVQYGCIELGPDQQGVIDVLATPGTIVTPRAYSTTDCTGEYSVGLNSARLILGLPGQPWIVAPAP